MFKHFAKITLRSIQKNKINTLITLFGLSLGLTCTIIIGLWVKYEMSYDRFHENSQDLYKAAFTHEPSDFHAYVLPAPVALHLKEEYPDIKNSTVFWNWGNKKIIQGENKILVNGSFVDPSFFSMFNFPLAIGTLSDAFIHPNSIVLTQSLAEKLFGDENPIGHTVKVDGDDEYIVTAVFEDIPANSDIQFEFLLPYQLISKYFDTWNSKSMEVYVQLNKGTDYSAVNIKIADVISQFKPDWNNKLYITPLTDCHLHNLKGGGRIQYVYILSIVAILILIIATFNIVNLTMATSDKRIKEIGLRKILGSGKKLLIIQFLFEAQILAMLALGIALIFVELLLPSVNNLLHVNLELSFNLYTILTLLGFAALTGLISGIYPASFLSSLRPIDLIKKTIQPFGSLNKNNSSSNHQKLNLRSGLVIFQFALTIILIAGIIVITQQVRFMKQKDLGFNKNDILIVQMQDELKHNYEAAKNELLMMPEISSISTSRSPLTVWWMSDMPVWDGRETDDVFDMGLNFVDYDFDETIGVEVIEGRFLSKEFSKDASDGFVINEAAVKAMDLENPVGTKMSIFDGTSSEQKGEIIGVIKNMHTESLHSEIKPFAFRYAPIGSFMFIKMNSSSNSKLVQTIKNKIEKIAPNDLVELSFLEDDLNELYAKEQTTEKLIGYSSLIAILISCLGLFGLSLYGLQKRIKEIGIRKVNGAMVSEILVLLNKDFIKWVAIAFVIAVPIAWYVMNQWLQNFAYRIGLSWWIFALAGFVALLIVLITVSFQVFKLARRNPVEALRYE
ncbi:FtsX-like permease family protein [Lentimicrobium sp. L6]|uniref:ABC transporter permease n=2 Tax=unclassified Lentimicrobium TaxID=2677434 RepID=UPI00155371DC|nr:ABC transporter permease [Lentimicrobium sp. L6]NPD84739.1 FtsX-like permease family protein [Lentimicrobium sp. L6]